MAYNTKPIVTDVDGNPISQYYNKELDQYEPVEGSGGGNKVVLYNADGTENNSLSLIPILEKLSELTGTVIDEQTRQSNEQQRITFYNQLVEMLNTGQLKGDKGDTGETGQGLEFDWDGTRLGVRVEGDEEYIYVDLRGPQGPPGVIENLTSQHIEDTLGYLPVSPNDLEELRQEVGEAHTSLNDRLGDLENLDTTEKANLVLALNETYQELAAHKAESASKHITESGENENGRYIKFDDGTLICTMTKSINYQTSDQSVQFVYPSSMRYYGSRRQANKNVAFSISSTKAYDGAGEGEVDYVYITHFSVTHENDGTGCTVQVKYDRDTSTRETDLMVMAIGRWK